MLQEAEAALASSALLPDPRPRLPIKRPPQLQALVGDNDTFHTPPTQRVPGPGMRSGNRPTAAGATASTTGANTSTGPKPAALTAQGLNISAGEKEKRDPASRLLNTTSGKSESDRVVQPPVVGSSGPSSSRLGAAPLPGWKQVVHSTDDDLAAVPAVEQTKNVPLPRQQLQTRLGPRSRRQRKGGSRLIHASSASGSGELLRGENSSWKQTGSEQEPQPDHQQQTEHAQPTQHEVDPILASPTQSPPIKLAIPCIIESPGARDTKRHAPLLEPQPQQDKNANDNCNEAEPPPSLLFSEPNIQAHDQFPQQQPAPETAYPSRGPGRRLEAGETPLAFNTLEATPAWRLEAMRPTPLGERTQLHYGPRPRLLPQSEAIPATPAGLFDISETPGGANHEDPAMMSRLHRISGTMLAHDASNKLLQGVFSPVTQHHHQHQHHHHPGAEGREQEEEPLLDKMVHAEAEETDPRIQQQQDQQGKDPHMADVQDIQHGMESEKDINRDAGNIHTNGADTQPPFSQLFHKDGIKEGIQVHGPAEDFYAGTCVPESVPSAVPPLAVPSGNVLPADKISALLAAEAIPESAPGSMEIDPIDTSMVIDNNNNINADPEAEPVTIGRHWGPCAAPTTAPESGGAFPRNGQFQSSMPQPHTALPTLRPFSSMHVLSSSIPGSTDRRLRFLSAQGEITPAPRTGVKIGKGGVSVGHLDINNTTLPRATTTTPATGLRSAVKTAYCPIPAPDEPLSLKLRLPQPVLAVVTSSDGQYMAVLLGSHADWEPSEVLLFSVSLEKGTEKETSLAQKETSQLEDLLPTPPAAAKVVAAVSVQRSRYAGHLSITPSSIAVASTIKGNPVLILSAVYELTEGPPSLGRPTIHAITCCYTLNSTNYNHSTDTGTSTSNWVADALGVESDDPFFSVAVVGQQSIIAVGDGSSGASVINFDPLWRSYSWGKTFSPAIGGTIIKSDGVVGFNSSLNENENPLPAVLDDVSRLIMVPIPGRKDECLLTALSANGMMGAWDMTSRSCVAVGGDARYAVRAAVPVLLEDPFSKPTTNIGANNSIDAQKHCFVVLLQRDGNYDTSVGVATLTPLSSSFILGPSLSLPGVTAIGSLTQDKVLLGCMDGTVRLWNVRSGECSIPIDVCSGAAVPVTSFALVAQTSNGVAGNDQNSNGGMEQNGGAENAVRVVVTSIAGDCVVLEMAALLEACGCTN